MQAGPRQHIAARFRVAVLRLVHMPKHDEMDSVHRARRSGSAAVAVLHSRFAPCAFLTATLSAKYSVMRSSDWLSSLLYFSYRNSFGSWSSWCATPGRARRLENSFFIFSPAY